MSCAQILAHEPPFAVADRIREIYRELNRKGAFSDALSPGEAIAASSVATDRFVEAVPGFGEFLVQMAELARLGTVDPVGADRLRQRLNRIIESKATEWFGLPPFVSEFRGWMELSLLGFPSGIHFEGVGDFRAFIEQGGMGWMRDFNIREVHIMTRYSPHSAALSLSDLEQLAHVHSLKRLTLQGMGHRVPQWTDAEVAILARIPQLAQLRLFHIAVSDASLRLLSRARHLKGLWIERPTPAGVDREYQRTIDGDLAREIVDQVHSLTIVE